MFEQIKKRNYSVIMLLVLFVLLIHFSLYSQKGRIRFENISLQEGLPQSTVYCILQDKTGFMWFGTQDGLCRYDGYQFKIYRNDFTKTTTISDNYILSIFEDKDGFIWIGTLGGGLNKFDPDSEKFTRYEYKPDNNQSISSNEVKCIHQDHRGNLWIGTNNGGLSRFDPTKGVFKRYIHASNDPKSLSDNTVWCIYEDKKGILWIGTEMGLDKFDPAKGQFKRCIQKTNSAGKQSDYKVRCILEDSEGIIWIGTEGIGLNKLSDKKNGIVERYQDSLPEEDSLNQTKVWCMCKETDQIMWIGTEKGLYIFDHQKGKFERYKHNPVVQYSLSNDDIRAIYKDRSGVTWLGIYGGGINKITAGNSGFKIYSYETQNGNTLSNNKVWAFCEDKSGAIWIGTENGLNRFEPEKDEFIRYNHDPKIPDSLSHNIVQTLFVDQNGQLWIGTYGGGLDKLLDSTGNGRFKHYQHNPDRRDSLSDDEIMCIMEDRYGVFWIGTRDKGVSLLENSTIDSFKHYQVDDSSHLSRNAVRCIYEDRDGIIWIGTLGGGLNKFDREKNEFIHFNYDPNNPSSLSSNLVRCIYENRKGVLWIGTDCAGLNKLVDRGKKIFKHFREEDKLLNDEKDKLPNNVIYGILEDEKGNLWLSTNKGLSCFDPETEKFRNYDVYDGLQSNEFNTGAYFKSDSGVMYFGGINGFNVFNPEKIKPDTTPPPVVITDFLISNKHVPLKGEDTQSLSHLEKPIQRTTKLILSYKQNMFTFEFAALHYAAPPKNKYRYRLEGWDRDWIWTDSNNRRATYTNLPGGDYIFRVTGSNKDGLWNHEGVFIKINILHPPWKTWWAYTLYVLSAMALVFLLLIINWRLEKRVKDRTYDLAQKKEALEKILSIVKSINSKMRLPDLLQSILEETKVIKGVEKASALVWEPGINRFVVKASSGWDMQQVSGIKLTRQQAEERFIKGTTEIFPDIFIATNISDLEHSDKIGTLQMPQAMLIVCIKIENETQAYFIFENMHDESAFAEQEKLLLNNLKEHFVAAFQKTRLITRLQNTQEQLVQAQKMISLGMMVAGIAHELKNPAVIVKMNVEYFSHVWEEIVPILEKYALSNEDFELTDLPFNESKAEIEKLLKGLLDGSKNIQNLIEELRTFSKKDDSTFNRDIDINKVIQSSINLTHNLVKKTTHRFASELAEELPLVRGNFQKLEQVLINLILNACQALPDTSRGVYISTAYDMEKKQIIIKVKDEGIGIEEQEKKHLTEPFFTTKSSTGGIGLGLSISSQIVREHRGTMKFESIPGQGTTVSVFLPVEITEENQKMEG